MEVKNEHALQDVLAHYVTENVNLKIRIRQLEMELEELKKKENETAK